MAEKSISQLRPRIVRPADAARLSGIPRSSLYWRISRGIFPPTIKLGPRSSGFLLDEIEAVIDAHVAGYSVDQIKSLVARLVAQRPGLAA